MAPAGDITSARANAAAVALLITYMVSYIDRTALSVLQEPIKREFGLSDGQLGLLGGPAFAILYSLSSLPIARLAERWNRTAIIAACLGLWSLMTAFCGLANSYLQLLLLRIGVSVGEAGGNPASHSLISDLFPPVRRARALSVYTLGAPVGAFLGTALAGWLAHIWDWRTAFLSLGALGIALMPVLLLIPRVPRGRFDARLTDTPPSTTTVLRVLLGHAAFRQLALGASLVVLVGYSVAAFLPSFLIRVHGIGVGEVGWIAGLINGAAAGVGTLFGGFAADRFGKRDVRLFAWIPGAMVLLAAPCFIAGFAWGTLAPATVLLMAGTAGIYTYIAPTFAQVHEMVGARMRATASAVLFLIINLVGLGLGPLLVGMVSDRAAAMRFAGLAIGDYVSHCRLPTVGMEVACRSSSAHGITVALILVSVLLIWAAAHFWLAGRRLARPLHAQASSAARREASGKHPRNRMERRSGPQRPQDFGRGRRH
jgi:predicted MFS family arabinose efflux permease